MSSTDEYQQQEFWINLDKEKQLLLQDLTLFGECIYQLEPEFKRIDPRKVDHTEYEGRE